MNLPQPPLCLNDKACADLKGTTFPIQRSGPNRGAAGYRRPVTRMTNRSSGQHSISTEDLTVRSSCVHPILISEPLGTAARGCKTLTSVRYQYNVLRNGVFAGELVIEFEVGSV